MQQCEGVVPVDYDDYGGYVEHPSVTGHSKRECEDWHVDHAVAVVEDGEERVPKPELHFGEAPFRDWEAVKCCRSE